MALVRRQLAEWTPPARRRWAERDGRAMVAALERSGLREALVELRETNNSLLSNKLNLTMKILTIFSAVLLPITLYSNVMAMSVSIPLSKNPDGFWIHSAVMLVLALGTILIFRAKKWF